MRGRHASHARPAVDAVGDSVRADLDGATVKIAMGAAQAASEGATAVLATGGRQPSSMNDDAFAGFDKMSRGDLATDDFEQSEPNSQAANQPGSDSDSQAPGQSPSATKKKPKKKLGWRIVFWVSLAVFVGALGVLGYYGYSYWHQQAQYEEIADEAVEFEDIDDSNLGLAAINWDTLKSINADCVGWIYIPNTMVNYPICYSGDDSTYLTKSFNGVYDGVTYGSIFLEARNNPDFSDQVNLLFGHNMQNGGMFGLVNKMHSKAEFDAHRTVYLLTPTGNYKMRTFALVNVPATEVSIIRQNFISKAELAEYVQDKINRSVVGVSDNPPATSMDKIVGLVTCDSGYEDAGRYILYCYVEESAVPISAIR